MARQTDQERVRQINDYVTEHPGSKPAQIARQLDVPRSSVMRALPALDDQGFLLYEDQRGRLWPFQK